MTREDLAGLEAALRRLEAELEASQRARQAALARCWREIERLQAPEADPRAIPPKAELGRLADFLFATAQTPGELLAGRIVGQVEQAVARALVGWVVRWRGEDTGYAVREFLTETLQSPDPVTGGAAALRRWAALWTEAEAPYAVVAALRAACGSLPPP